MIKELLLQKKHLLKVAGAIIGFVVWQYYRPIGVPIECVFIVGAVCTFLLGTLYGQQNDRNVWNNEDWTYIALVFMTCIVARVLWGEVWAYSFALTFCHRYGHVLSEHIITYQHHVWFQMRVRHDRRLMRNDLGLTM